MPGLFATSLPLLVHAVVSIWVMKFSFSRGSVAQRMLAGLSGFMLSEMGAVAEGDTGKTRKDAKAPAKELSVEEAFNKANAVGTNIGLFKILPHSILVKLFYAELNMTIFCALLLAANFAASLVLRPLGHPSPDVLIPCLAALAAGRAFRGLFVTQLDPTTPPAEKQLSLLVCVLSMVTAMLTLTVVPERVLGFPVAGAARDLTASFAAFQRRRGSADARGSAAPPFEFKPEHLHVAMGSISGLLSGAAVGPAVRWVRCMHTAAEPPGWLASHVYAGHRARAAMAAGLLAPWAAAVASVPRLVAEPLGLGPEAAGLLRGALLAGGGALHFALLRPLCQAWLHSALLLWFEMRHVSGISADHAVAAMRYKFQLASTLLCKVALQVVGPATIFLSLGTLLIDRRPSLDAVLAAAQPLLPPAAMRTVVGFVGFWLSLTWAAISCTMLTVIRAGLDKN